MNLIVKQRLKAYEPPHSRQGRIRSMQRSSTEASDSIDDSMKSMHHTHTVYVDVPSVFQQRVDQFSERSISIDGRPRSATR